MLHSSERSSSSVDLESFKSISSLSSPSPKLGAHLREDLGETLVCAFEVAYLVALGGDCDCGFHWYSL